MLLLVFYFLVLSSCLQYLYRSPIILGVVESNKKENVSTVLLYGHFDKQPAFDDQVKWGPYL